MSRSRLPSPGTVLGFVALMVALGGTALAATGELVNIADGTTASRLTKVDTLGRLHVGDGGGAMTVDGYAPEAPPSTFVRGRAISDSATSCRRLLAAPAGRAVILRSVHAGAFALNGSGSGQVALYTGAPDCSSVSRLEVLDTREVGMQTLSFEPGVAIPAGKALLMIAHQGAFDLTAYGFTVPAGQVPASAASAEPEAAPGPPERP